MSRRPSQLSTAAVSSSPGCGWLLKLGGQVKQFKRRFVRISGQRIEYFRSPPTTAVEEANTNEKENRKSNRLGVFPLTGARLTEFADSIYGRPHVFGLKPVNSKRTFVFQCESQADREKWVGEIKLLLDQRSLTGPKYVVNSLREGFVSRWSEDKKKFSDRFIILTENQIEFRKERDGNTAGIIPFDGQVSVIAEFSAGADVPPSESGFYSFTVQAANSSKRAKYFLRTSKETDRDEWVTSIHNAIVKFDSANSSELLSASPSSSSPLSAAGSEKTEKFQYSESESDDLSEMSLDSNSEPESARDEKADKKLFPKTAAAPPRASPIQEKTVRLMNSQKPLAQRETQRIVFEGILKRLTAPKSKLGKPEFAKLVGWTLRLFAAKDDEKWREEIHLIATVTAREPESTVGFPFVFSITESLAACRTFYFQAANATDYEEWLYIIDLKHSFSDVGLPLSLNAKVHVNMCYSPDAKQLNAITVNAGNEIKEEEVPETENETMNVPSSSSSGSLAVPVGHTKNNSSLTSSNVATTSQAREVSRSLIKSAVSKRKRRFIVEGFDLDLTYCTDRIIAMGFPSEGLEAIYRNRMDDVQRFFEVRHHERFKIYNLCSERKYPHERFQNRVCEFPFDDHQCPMFQDMAYFCADVADWLNAHPKNICVIHCKAGKGRTGLMICVFLLYLGEWRTADEALRYYAFARTQNQKGVTIPSQIRFVHYFDRYMSLSRAGLQLPEPQAITLKRLKFGKGAPSFDIMTAKCRENEWNSKDFPLKQIKHKDGSVEYLIESPESKDSSVLTPYTFLADFHVEFSKKKTFGGKARCMGFWLHTQFINDNYLKLKKSEIDKVNKKKEAPVFELELFFENDNEFQSRQQKKSDELMALGREFVSKGGFATRYLEKWDDQTLEFYMWIRDENEATRKPGEKPEIHDFVLCCCDSDKKENYNSVKDIPEKERTQLFRFSAATNIMVGSTHEIWQQHALAKTKAVEDRCFSILNNEGPEGSNFAPLHLEAPTERQLTMWLEGIKSIYSSVGSMVEDKQEQKHSQPELAAGEEKSEEIANQPEKTADVVAAAGSQLEALTVTAPDGSTSEETPAAAAAMRGRRASITTRRRVISFYNGSN